MTRLLTAILMIAVVVWFLVWLQKGVITFSEVYRDGTQAVERSIKGQSNPEENR